MSRSAGREAFGEDFLQSPCELAGFSVPHRTIIELHDRHHVGGGTGEKELADPWNLGAFDRAFVERDVQIAGKVAKNGSRDAGENVIVARVRAQRAIDYTKKVRLGTL